jgi:hypothetical protein
MSSLRVFQKAKEFYLSYNLQDGGSSVLLESEPVVSNESLPGRGSNIALDLQYCCYLMFYTSTA